MVWYCYENEESSYWCFAFTSLNMKSINKASYKHQYKTNGKQVNKNTTTNTFCKTTNYTNNNNKPTMFTFVETSRRHLPLKTFIRLFILPFKRQGKAGEWVRKSSDWFPLQRSDEQLSSNCYYLYTGCKSPSWSRRSLVGSVLTY